MRLSSRSACRASRAESCVRRMKPPSRRCNGRSGASAAFNVAAQAGSAVAIVAAASASSAGRGPAASIAAAMSQAASSPSRSAARSRGPLRPSASRLKARARSGTPFSAFRTVARKDASAWKNVIESSRRPMAATSVNGAPRRSASRRLPPGVAQRSIAASSEPARTPDNVRVSSRLARVAASISMRPPRRRLRGRSSGGRAASCVRAI